MTTTKPTVAGMRALLDRLDAVKNAQSELPLNATTGAIQSEVALIHDQLVNNAPDYLRALLPVVEAAVALSPFLELAVGRVTDDQYVTVIELWTRYLDALKALE